MPLKKGSSPETVGENIAELHTGKTFAHAAKKFGKKRAQKQSVAVALNQARKTRRKGTKRVHPAVRRAMSRGLISEKAAGKVFGE